MCVGKMVRVHRSAAPDLAKACAFSPALTSLSTTTAGPHPDCRCNGASLEWLLLTVVCRCGVVFERWVTSVDADDLISWVQLEAIRN